MVEAGVRESQGWFDLEDGMTDSGPLRQCSEAFCQICRFHHFCAACPVFSTPLSVCFCVLSCPWASGFFASYTWRAKRPGRAFGQRLMWPMYVRQLPCLEGSLMFPCPPWGFAWLASSISLLPLFSTGFFWEHVLNKLLAHKSLLRVCSQGTQLNTARKAGVKGQSQVWETSPGEQLRMKTMKDKLAWSPHHMGFQCETCNERTDWKELGATRQCGLGLRNKIESKNKPQGFKML